MGKNKFARHRSLTYLFTTGAVALLIYIYSLAQGLTLPWNTLQPPLRSQSFAGQAKTKPTAAPTPTIVENPTTNTYITPITPSSQISPEPTTTPTSHILSPVEKLLPSSSLSEAGPQTISGVVEGLSQTLEKTTCQLPITNC